MKFFKNIGLSKKLLIRVFPGVKSFVLRKPVFYKTVHQSAVLYKSVEKLHAGFLVKRTRFTQLHPIVQRSWQKSRTETY